MIQNAKKIVFLSLALAHAGSVLADDISGAQEVVRCTQKVWWEGMPTSEIDLHIKVKGEYVLMADDKHLYLADSESNETLAKMKVREKAVYASSHGKFVSFYGQSSGLIPSIVKSVNFDVERRIIRFDQNFIFGGESMFYSGTRECLDVRGNVARLLGLFEDKKKKEEGQLPRKMTTRSSDLEILYFGTPGSIQESSAISSSRCHVGFQQEGQAMQTWEIGGLLATTSFPVSRHVEICQGLANKFKNGYLGQLEIPVPVANKQLNLIRTFFQESNIPGLNAFERARLNPEPVTLVRPLNQWLCVAYFKQNDFYPGGGSNAQIQWRLSGDKEIARNQCAQLLATYKTKYIDQLENPVENYRQYFLELVEDQHQ